METIDKIAKDILSKEIVALRLLDNLIDTNQFKQAIDLLTNTSGAIIVSGIGKSGHIGAKISATLSSTGSRSFFIHPTEASHGDMGAIGEHDSIIFISNSGNTTEMKDIVIYAKDNNINSIGIISAMDSFIAQNVTIPLVTGKIHEALSIPAPTSSTTLALVLGDVIAGCLSYKKKFSQIDYLKLHRGGKLGKQLSNITNFMITGDRLPFICPDQYMSDAIIEMTNKGFGIAIVSKNKTKILGIVSDGDLRRHMSQNLMTDKVESVMTSAPKTVSPDSLVIEVINFLTKHKILVVPIVKDDGTVLGLVQLYDLLS